MMIKNKLYHLFGIAFVVVPVLCIDNPISTRLLRKTSEVVESKTIPTCHISEESLPEFIQDPRLEYGEHPGVVFLLGTPFTGTTAVHYMLGTSGNVSILGENTMSPHKEGWHKIGLKDKMDGRERWDGELASVNWTDVAEQYGTFWDTSKKLLVENSPPEIQVPEKLVDAFTPKYGKVRFILLVRGVCGNNSPDKMSYRSAMYKNVVDKFPQDTFVIRYEDICLRWEKVFADLVKWEPLLADIDINFIADEPNTSRRLKRDHHDWKQMSVKNYCDMNLQKWSEGLKCESCESDLDFMKQWGYDKTFDEDI